MNKYLILGGTHGNEPLGLEVCKRLKKLNLSNVDVLFANEKAIRANKRFIDSDLNRVFPGKSHGTYEEMRARTIMNMCKSYDFIIDFHNTNTPNNDCGFVGGEDWKESANLASFLGLNKVIVANYDCINKYVKNCLSVEISLSSKQCDVDYWVNQMLKLGSFDPRRKTPKPKMYTFSYRITREQQNTFKFPKWVAFKTLSKKYLKQLQLEGIYYPIFIDDTYTPYNYAGLIQKL